MLQEGAGVGGGTQRVLFGRRVTKIGTNPDVGEGQVRVRFDQARHERATVAVDDACAFRGQGGALRHDGGDAIAFHQHLRSEG